MVVANSFDEVISLIKDRLDIVDVISQHVVLKKSGANYWGICPFHNDSKPSMSVSPSKGIYKCFSCGTGGDALNFIVRIQNREYKDVILELAEKFDIELPKKFSSSNETKNQKIDMLKACEKAAKFYNLQLKIDSDANKATSYLESRNITEDIIQKFTLGWAPDKFDALYKELSKEFKDEILEKAGLILKSNNGKWIDRFRNRLMIPIQNENGEYVAFGGRTLEKDAKIAKYINSSDSLIYNKSKILFGLNSAKDAIKNEDSVIIMEGYFDVISAQANGVENAVASCGTAMTAEHVKLLSRYTKSRRIFLSFDTDNAGIKATKRGSEVIKETLATLGNVKQFDESHISSSLDNKYACEIRVVAPPQGKDPDEFIRTMGGDAFKMFVKEAPLLIDFLLNNILKEKSLAKTPQEKAELVSQIIEILKDVDNKIIQSEYVKMVATVLEIDENAMLKELNKFNYQNQIQYLPQKQTVVTKSSQFEEKAQKNLLSVFLSNIGSNNYQKLNELLPQDIIQNETLIIVKNTIDKFACTVNNVSELTKQLYTEFIEDDNLTLILTDLVEMSEAFNGLAEEDLERAVNENIIRLKRCYQERESEKLRKQYREVNDDDLEALKIQMQLRDKIKLRTGDK